MMLFLSQESSRASSRRWSGASDISTPLLSENYDNSHPTNSHRLQSCSLDANDETPGSEKSTQSDFGWNWKPRNDKFPRRINGRHAVKQKPEAYEDIPGTWVFDAQRARIGYRLNEFLYSLMKAENRKAFLADERSYLLRIG